MGKQGPKTPIKVGNKFDYLPDSPPEVPDVMKTEVERIWNLLSQETELDSDLDWPCEDILMAREYLIPEAAPEAGPMPIGFAHLLRKDLRKSSLTHRVDLAAMNMSRPQLEKYHHIWINIIHSFLSVYTNASRPRTRATSRLQCCIDNIEGYDLFDNEKDIKVESTNVDEADDDDEDEDSSKNYKMDVQKCITTMSNLFPESTRLSGEESETFNVKLKPIVGQMNALAIPPEHQPAVLFSLTTGKAREAASRIPLENATVDTLIHGITSMVLYDHNIQERRVNRWNCTQYKDFRVKQDSEEPAARACIEFLTSHQKDLPQHMVSPELLLARLKDVFRTIPWCQMLYQQSAMHVDPHSFAQQILSAASSQDLQKKNNMTPSQGIAPYPVLPAPIQAPSVMPPSNLNLTAFFAKTPPPPKHRRPYRFQRRPGQRFGSFRSNHRGNYRFRSRPPPGIRKHRKLCYGCGRPGHFLRDCPDRDRHMNRLQHMVDIGQAANFLIEHDHEEHTDQNESVLQYMEESQDALPSSDVHAEGDEEFDDWVCAMLDAYDSGYDQQSTFFIKISIPELIEAMQEMSVHSAFPVLKHIMIDTGAPKPICTEPWLQDASWTPVRKLPLPDNMRPFRFAGHPVNALYAACLVSIVRDIRGHPYYFRKVVFVLPPTPIPFLFGLQDQRRLGFDICLREQNASHIKATTMGNAIFPVVVTSHLWLPFEPCNRDPNPQFDWEPLISQAFDTSSAAENNHVMDSFPVRFDTSDADAVLDLTSDKETPKEIPIPPWQRKDWKSSPVQAFTSETFQRSPHHSNSAYPVPPWKQDSWKSHTSAKQVHRLHEGLKHPPKTSLLKLLRQLNNNEKLPDDVMESIVKHQCRECAANPQLPRVPKLSLPAEATPNVAVSLDIMPHTINNVNVNVLVMIDEGDLMLRLKYLHNMSASTAFQAYFSKWIAYFDAPVFTVVDRGTNLVNQLMANELRALQSQLCPIPTEAPWALGQNERSHRYLHNVINKLLSDARYEVGREYEKLLADVEMAWNFCLHTNNVLPHFHRFGVMPRILGELSDPSTISQRIALMELARQETASARAESVLRRAMDPRKRNVLSLRSFTVNQVVWFYRKRHGWRKGVVSGIDRPTIFVFLDGKLFPTHEARVRPYFDEVSMPPDVLDDDPDLYESLEQPTTGNEVPDQRQTTSLSGQAPISELLNGVFVATHLPSESSIDLDIPNTSFAMQFSECSNGVIDSNNILLTEVSYHKDVTKLPQDQQVKFMEAKLEEIAFLLKKAVKPVPRVDVPISCELQPLKWVLAIKRSSNNAEKVRYRARLVSASSRSRFRHTVHGNAPTVALSTVRIAYAIVPTWIADQNGDDIHMFTRDVTKAYLQSKPSQRLVFYRPPKEFMEAYPDIADHAWKAIVQLYGDVEAGLYWNQTFVPWLVQNIPDLKQSVYDPSLLYSPTMPAFILLCTDDTSVVIPGNLLESEAKIENRFECRERQLLPTDFKGIDISKEGTCIVLSQADYLKSHQDSAKDSPDEKPTKMELQREMTKDELREHRKVAGQLAWVATGTSPSSAFAASVALQGSTKLLHVKFDTIDAFKRVQVDLLSTLRYVPLDYDTTHIRLYSDGAFQNLDKKHSQVGYIVALCDKIDRFNIVHWHSSRAPRRAHSTEESEMMALDIALRNIRNMRKIVFELLKKEVPIVAYVDNMSLWNNLMNQTVSSMPEVMYRCREYIHDGTIASVCLIPGDGNPADAMTKAKPNKALDRAVLNNFCRTVVARTFMLQSSPYRHADYIPTSRVPMPGDDAVDCGVSSMQQNDANTQKETSQGNSHGLISISKVSSPHSPPRRGKEEGKKENFVRRMNEEVGKAYLGTTPTGPHISDYSSLQPKPELSVKTLYEPRGGRPVSQVAHLPAKRS